MFLGNKQIGAGYPTFVIAELGINHNGSIDLAKKLIKQAVDCGVDCVKFQKRSINKILTKEGLNKAYDNPNSFGKTYGEHKEFLEFDEDQFKELKAYAESLDVIFTASGWDEESVDLLDRIGCPFFKMASADLTNYRLLEHTAKKGKPMIISTGMADMQTVKEAYHVITKHNPDVVILHCTSSYPTPDEEINLRVIKTFEKEFPDAIIGFSGHEHGIHLTHAAVVMGAKVIERHYTLDRCMKGGDHQASLEKSGMEKLVRNIRSFENALGSAEKTVQPSEHPCLLKLTKSLVTAKPIKSGMVITADMLDIKGPGSGISAKYFNTVPKKYFAKRDLEEDVVLTWDDIQELSA